MTVDGHHTRTANHSAERFAPLLRELVRAELVERTDSGTWVLRDDVQRVLDSYSHRHPAQVYVGYHCQRCGTIAITRESGGQHLCSACIYAQEVGEDTTEPAEPESPARGRLRFRSRRHAG